MYLFGYRNFVSTADDLGFSITRHLSVNGGYQLGSRLVVNNSASNNRIGPQLTQSGAIVGLQVSLFRAAYVPRHPHKILWNSRVLRLSS